MRREYEPIVNANLTILASVESLRLIQAVLNPEFMSNLRDDAVTPPAK